MRGFQISLNCTATSPELWHCPSFFSFLPVLVACCCWRRSKQERQRSISGRTTHIPLLLQQQPRPSSQAISAPFSPTSPPPPSALHPIDAIHQSIIVFSPLSLPLLLSHFSPSSPSNFFPFNYHPRFPLLLLTRVDAIGRTLQVTQQAAKKDSKFISSSINSC